MCVIVCTGLANEVCPDTDVIVADTEPHNWTTLCHTLLAATSLICYLISTPKDFLLSSDLTLHLIVWRLI